MRIFSINSNLRPDGTQVVANVSCTLSMSELQQIKLALESLKKTDNEVVMSVREEILRNITEVCHV